jgi:hypothetical protein
MLTSLSQILADIMLDPSQAGVSNSEIYVRQVSPCLFESVGLVVHIFRLRRSGGQLNQDQEARFQRPRSNVVEMTTKYRHHGVPSTIQLQQTNCIALILTSLSRQDMAGEVPIGREVKRCSELFVIGCSQLLLNRTDEVVLFLLVCVGLCRGKKSVSTTCWSIRVNKTWACLE